MTAPRPNIRTPRTLSGVEFKTQLMEHRGQTIASVVIRGEQGDYALASIHREGDVLVFDLGAKLPKEGP